MEHLYSHPGLSENLQRDCLFGMRHFLNGYFLLLDIYIKKDGDE